MHANYKRRYQQSVNYIRYEYNIRVQNNYRHAGNQVVGLVITLPTLLQKVSKMDSYDHCVDNEDIDSCKWTLELFVNYWDGYLIKRIEEKYETLDELEQGGITYLNFAFDGMSSMSNFVITSLYDFIKKFSKGGIS